MVTVNPGGSDGENIDRDWIQQAPKRSTSPFRKNARRWSLGDLIDAALTKVASELGVAAGKAVAKLVIPG